MDKSSSPKSKPQGIRFMLRALRYKNYRLFFGGQIVSLMGTWMTSTATSWLVYRLTGSALLLGLVGFCSQMPAFILLPFAGLVVDRVNRRKLLLITQILSMIQSFALAILTLGHWITMPWLLVLSAFQGLINAFDMPGRHSFVVEMIEDKKDLGNAIALNSSLFNMARLLGPAIGGMIIAAWGEGWCFLIDGFSYVAVILALLALVVKPHPVSQKSGNALTQFKEGWQYAAKSKPIRSMIGLLALVSLMGVPYTVLMPVFAKTILGGGPHTLGFLMAAIGAGALLGALWLAARQSVRGLARVILYATAAFGVGLIAFSFSHTLWLSLILLVMVGCGFMLQSASSNTILQTIVEDDKRGRIMSLFVMAFMGTVPFGSLLAGSLSQSLGAPNTLRIGGLCCIAGFFWFNKQLPEIRKSIRPIYVQLGIIREIADGLETSNELSLPSKE